MTNSRSFLVAVFLVMLIWTLPCVAAEAPYKPGEVIHYNIKQGPIKMGEASLTFVGEKDLDGRKAVLILFSSKGPAFFDNEEIYVDPLTLRPIKVLRDLKIFGGHEKIIETYGSDGKIVISKDADGKKTETVLTKKGPVDNIYGFIYRYRSEGDFSPKQTFKVGLPTVDLTMTIVDDGNFNAAGKTYRSAVIRSVPSKYTIWMDKGTQRLPLRIGGAVGIGNTVMTMVSVEEKTLKSEVRGQKSEEKEFKSDP